MCLTQKVMSEKLVGIAVESDLTPSGAMSAKGGKAKFDSLCTGLQLNTKAIVSPIPVLDERTANDAKFSFVWRDGNQEKKEGESYDATCAAVTKLVPSELVAIVGEGKNVALGGLLFKKKIFTLRKQNPFQHRGQRVEFVSLVSGRSDIAILRYALKGGEVLGSNVRAIEVKPPSILEKNRDGCDREAMVQLIGLCARNTFSVVVVLTNLVKYHRVFYLVLADEEPLRFEIHVQQFDDFITAVRYALNLPQCENTLQFGRPTSPLTSIADSGDDSNSGDGTDVEQ